MTTVDVNLEKITPLNMESLDLGLGKVNVVDIGVKDHDKLNNLGYEESGHTGFASSEALNAVGERVSTIEETIPSLQDEIKANANAITTLSEGIDPEKIDGLKEVAEYVNKHVVELAELGQDVESLDKRVGDLEAIGIPKDGLTPYIKDGNWFIGEQNTGVQAEGKDGLNGTNGVNGITPHIGADGNWYIGDTNTGIYAKGKDGTNGVDGVGISEITSGESYEEGDNTITPITFNKTDNSKTTINVYAKNGKVADGNLLSHNIVIQDIVDGAVTPIDNTFTLKVEKTYVASGTYGTSATKFLVSGSCFEEAGSKIFASSSPIDDVLMVGFMENNGAVSIMLGDIIDITPSRLDTFEPLVIDTFKEFPVATGQRIYIKQDEEGKAVIDAKEMKEFYTLADYCAVSNIDEKGIDYEVSEIEVGHGTDEGNAVVYSYPKASLAVPIVAGDGISISVNSNGKAEIQAEVTKDYVNTLVGSIATRLADIVEGEGV